jgi:hypothetical protein
MVSEWVQPCELGSFLPLYKNLINNSLIKLNLSMQVIMVIGHHGGT